MQHIVYIEDNEINATVFKHLMSPLYPVRVYESGESYFKEVGEKCTDLPIIYFLDLNLGRGRMSGKEILDKLNKLECTRAVPKVAFTAYAFDSEEMHDIEDQGFNACLSKPGLKNRMVEVFQRLVE